MESSFFNEQELKQIGFKSVGSDVLISRFARLYGTEKMEIGNNVRIDDFCLLSGSIKLGNYIHISAYSALYGRYGIEMEDYSGVSPRCTVFSASDDFSGNFLIGPMVNPGHTNVNGGKVLIKRYSQLGSNSVVLPAVTIYEGVATGAMTLVNRDLAAWGIYVGVPAKFVKPREKNLLNFVK